MGDTVGDLIVKRLKEWGVKRIFGYPGDGINGIIGALERAHDEPAFIQVRHEETAAFMAGAHSKWTGEVGVCLATSGPGAIHLLNGLYDAKLDHQSVVAIVGQQPTTALGGNYQQEVDLHTLFKDVAHEYVHMATSPQQFPNLIDRAMRIAKAMRTVTCVIVPANLQEEAAEEQAPHKFKMVPGTVGYSEPRVMPKQGDLMQAADILNEGKKVAMLVGQGARGAADEVLQTADLLGAGIAKALLGKDAVPDDLPNVTGAIGLLGTKPSYEMMMDCDTLLMVGSSFPYVQFLPEWGQARAVQIDISGIMMGIRYPMDCMLIGDAKETLQALLPMLERKEDRSWEQTIRKNVERWWEIVEARAMNDADPLNPQRVFWELSKRLPEQAIIAADSGSGANWFARDIKIRRGMMCSLSGTLATMGPAVPYAMAAKFAYPDRIPIALVGDGAFQMNGLNEMLTVARYWKQWDDPRIIFMVLNNHDLNQVTWEQRAMEGDPKFEPSQTVPDFDYAGYAGMLGFKGIRVDNPDRVGDAWDEAFSSDRPVILEAVTDPNVPPLPPHVEWEQAKKLMKAIMSGDPDTRAVIKEGFRGKIEEFLHR